MASNISHDLYQLQRGRRVLAQQYGEHDKDAAIRKARELFAFGQYDAVGVMRERYDPNTGSSTNTLVYGNTKSEDVPNLHGRVVKPETSTEPSGPRRGPDLDNEDDFEDAPGPAASRGHGAIASAGPSSGTVFRKFVLVFTISLLLAGGVWFILSRFGFESSLASLLGERDLPLKVIIVGSFLFSFVIGPTLITGRDLQAIFYSSDAEPSPRRGGRTGARTGSRQGAAPARSRAAASDEEDDDFDDEDDDDEEDEEEEPPEPKLDKATAGKLTGARETMVAFFELCLRFINDAELPTKTGKLDPLMTFG